MTDVLKVLWDKALIGELERAGDAYGIEYEFRYSENAARAISVALPLRADTYAPAECRPFFEALLPEGTVRETLAAEFRLPLNDSFGLLRVLGRDCAGALQILEERRMSETPDLHRLDETGLSKLIVDLPRRPLGIEPSGRMRLSLAGVQRKAVLVRDRSSGRFGEPLNGMPSTHLLKPEPLDAEYPGMAMNEYFCMLLAAAVGLPTAEVELLTIADRPCLVVARFDRDLDAVPVGRIHQEDLCQAIGLTPGFKYAAPDRPRPSFKDIGDVLAAFGSQPGRDRLTAGRMAMFNFLTGNADAHGKNVSFLHGPRGGLRLAPLYDLLSTAVWSELSQEMAMAIGDEFDPANVTPISFDDLGLDLRLRVAAFRRERGRFVAQVQRAAGDLLGQARRDGWHAPILEKIAAVITERSARVI